MDKGMRPVIGIVMDWTESGSYSPRPHYAIRDTYFKAVWSAGGLPVALPLIDDARADYVARMDGILLPGGDYPSPSRWYGDGHGIPDEHPRTIINEQIIRDLLQLNKPLLAICAGHQELCAATGGLLWWRVSESVPNALNHRAGNPREMTHTVKIEKGTLLHKLTQTEEMPVNSHHYEAVRQVGEGVVISGRAPDGVIEAIEVPGKTFALGVQWHTEFLLTENDRMIFQGFIEAARAAE